MLLRLISNVPFDEKLFEVLLPFADAWRNGYVDVRCGFASPSLLERAYNELLLCKRMFVYVRVDGQLSQPFTSLLAIRECTLLRVLRPPSPLGMEEILVWLNVDARSKEPKRFRLCASALADSIGNLVQLLKTVGV